MPRLILDTTLVGSIPVLTLSRDDLSRAPMVFFIHGYRGSRIDNLSLGYRLAEQGFFYVALDAHLHGDRYSQRQIEPHPQPIYPPATGLDVWHMLITEIVPQTARDIGVLIDHFAADPRVDATRTGVTGASMGGFTTFYLAANEPRIRAAAPMISYPGFSSMWSQFVTEAASYPQWADAMSALRDESERRAEDIREIDPMEKLKAFAPGPLLMIQGDKDTDTPKHTSVMLYQTLCPLYNQHPDRLKLSIYDGVDHRVVREMEQEVVGWFSQMLP
jgi:uncharacterized protein